MRIFFDITGWTDAIQKLKELRLDSWDKWEEVQCNDPNVSSPIVYFQKNNTDIAYLVKGIGLAIFDKPRKHAL